MGEAFSALVGDELGCIGACKHVAPTPLLARRGLDVGPLESLETIRRRRLGSAQCRVRPFRSFPSNPLCRREKPCATIPVRHRRDHPGSLFPHRRVPSTRTDLGGGGGGDVVHRTAVQFTYSHSCSLFTLDLAGRTSREGRETSAPKGSY